MRQNNNNNKVTKHYYIHLQLTVFPSRKITKKIKREEKLPLCTRVKNING